MNWPDQCKDFKMKLCACCSGKMYEQCCYSFICGTARPATAEQLMRSRYTAYTRWEAAYIIGTTHPSTRRLYDSKAITAWAASSVWEKLEILSTSQGTSTDAIGYVEFKAYYSDSEGKTHIHHEHSIFKRSDADWFFVEGEVY